METDTNEAARFLAALASESEHTFQTYTDRSPGAPKLKRDPFARHRHGTLQRRALELSSLNLKGAGVFVMVNRGDGLGRKADNVLACRALFVDLDGAPLEPVLSAPIPPRIVVESSPGKWHAYWPVVDLPPERFSAAQKSLALRFNGDPSVSDRSRVMRVPGFWHNKGAPFRTRLVDVKAGRLTWTEMAEAYDLADRFRLPHAIPEGERNSTLFALAASARQKCVPEAAQLAKAFKVNETRCHPPLSEQEVRTLVANAYRIRSQATFGVPLELWESSAFKALDSTARVIAIAAYLRADGFNGGRVTLPWSELVDWFPDKKTFLAARKRAVSSGLLTIATAPTKAMPRKKCGPKPAFYQIAIGPFSPTHYRQEIGAVFPPPEAFQAGAVCVLDPALDASGPAAVGANQ